MNTRFVLLALVLSMMAVPAIGAAADDVTLKGEPVDMQCYMGGQSGPGHASCATACANKGIPIGFLTKNADGESELYLVMGADQKPAKDYMAAHMGKIVEAKGTVTEKDGLKILTVSEVTGD